MHIETAFYSTNLFPAFDTQLIGILGIGSSDFSAPGTSRIIGIAFTIHPSTALYSLFLFTLSALVSVHLFTIVIERFVSSVFTLLSLCCDSLVSLLSTFLFFLSRVLFLSFFPSLISFFILLSPSSLLDNRHRLTR